MDPKTKDEKVNREDPDSGLDNTSESGHSADEDQVATSSELEDILNSDHEGNSLKKEKQSECEKPSSAGHQKVVIKTTKDDSKTENLDFRIELNNNYKLMEEEYKEEVVFFQNLIKGQSETIDFSITSTSNRPEWLDEEKFKRGQKFARDHLFCINFSEMVSLFLLFVHKTSVGPLIASGRSDAPYTAFKRYFSTLMRLLSWYEDDIWNESDSVGSKNINSVRGMHKFAYQKLTNSSPEEVEKKTTLGDPNTTAMWCPMRETIVNDFRESVPMTRSLCEGLGKWEPNETVWVNQADMSITQFAFVGMAVTFPKYFGIYLASDDDLDAFVHLWRGLGYLLGIKEEYNFCNGGLEAVRRRTKFYVEAVAKPSFKEANCDWEHMSRCLTAGIAFYLPEVNFESSFLYLCDILEVDARRLRKRMSFHNYFIYLLHRLVFSLMKFSAVLKFLNSKLYEAIKKVQNCPPEVLSKWKSREFSYMKQPGKCQIRNFPATQEE